MIRSGADVDTFLSWLCNFHERSRLFFSTPQVSNLERSWKLQKVASLRRSVAPPLRSAAPPLLPATRKGTGRGAPCCARSHGFPASFALELQQAVAGSIAGAGIQQELLAFGIRPKAYATTQGRGGSHALVDS